VTVQGYQVQFPLAPPPVGLPDPVTTGSQVAGSHLFSIPSGFALIHGKVFHVYVQNGEKSASFYHYLCAFPKITHNDC
jgi:hypothetical protein